MGLRIELELSGRSAGASFEENGADFQISKQRLDVESRSKDSDQGSWRMKQDVKQRNQCISQWREFLFT